MHDFQAAEKTADERREFESTDFLANISGFVGERLYAVKYTLQIYDAISCKADKERVKGMVKEQLDMNAWLINYDTDRVAGVLSFVKVPSTAQMGLKMKDEMRAAKEKLDAIAGSLD